MGRKPWCCKIHLVAEHPRQWSETAGESEAEEGEGEEGEVIQEGVVAGIFHDGIKSGVECQCYANCSMIGHYICYFAPL